MGRPGLRHSQAAGLGARSRSPSERNRLLRSRRFDDLDESMRQSLFAWLRGFERHWPAQFEAVLGVEGKAALRALAGAGSDMDRYLKLRRIAIENLAGCF